MIKLYFRIGIVCLFLLFPLALISSEDASGVPEKPANLKVTETDAAANSLTLTWEPVPGATGYYVYQGLLNRINQGWTRWRTTTPDPITTATVVVRRVTLNTNYLYRVTAYNDSGEGAPSDYIEVNITR